MKMFMLLAAGALALSAGAAHAAVLYDNGPVADGKGLSVFALPATVYGFGAQTAANIVVADDFRISGGAWTISSLDFYGYQTGASAFSFTSAAWSIVSGDANSGSVVASGTTAVTNGGLMGYRVLDTATSNTSRAIYRLNADMDDFTLAAGDYVLRWSLAGTGASGPWVPPVLGSLGSGNALQSTSGAFIPLLDDAKGADLPFTINGTSGAVPEPATWAMMIGGLGLVGASMRRRSVKLGLA